MAFSVEIYDQTGNAVKTELFLSPSFYSSAAMGGYKRAEIDVSGGDPNIWDVVEWLNYQVIIRNGAGVVVWSGVVIEATVVRPALVVGASIERMANKVAVLYNYSGPDGQEIQGQTAWATDSGSILLYGTKERIISLADTREEVAIAKRDTHLASLKNPIPVLEFDGGDVGARLVCLGLWDTLAWSYYQNLEGLEEYDVATTEEHGIGWQLIANTIGFKETGIHDIQARLADFPRDCQVRITGSVSNNTAYMCGSVPSKDKDLRVVYTNTTISFDPSDDITDSVGGLGPFGSGEMIKVSGSTAPANNAYRWVKTAGDLHIEATPGTIVSSAAGPSVTVEKGHALKTEAKTVLEVPGATCTLWSRGTILAQKWHPTGSTTWTAQELEVKIGIIGSPSDSLRVALFSDSGGIPGTELAYGLVIATDAKNRADWIAVTLNAPVTITPGANYFIALWRTGAPSYTDYWTVALETAVLTADPFIIWDVNAWWPRDPNSRMPYRVWATKETTLQIRDMLTASGRFTGISITVSSQIKERQWRAGDQKTLDEIIKLMDSGTLLGKKVFALTTPNKGVMVYQQPDPGDRDPIYTNDGRLLQAGGGAWDEGVLPSGRYVQLQDIPVRAGFMQSLMPVLIDEAEYDAKSGTFRLTPWAMDEETDY